MAKVKPYKRIQRKSNQKGKKSGYLVRYIFQYSRLKKKHTPHTVTAKITYDCMCAISEKHLREFTGGHGLLWPEEPSDREPV